MSPYSAKIHSPPAAAAPLEMWAGIECTINRVQDRYFDQLSASGHAGRASDLERIAALAVKTVRYPVLWEQVAPLGLGRADWSWPDERLVQLRALGITPIVGLVHHGSGPASTNLMDDSFAPGLAEFAGAVAARYPWLRDFTPVNEPLTTARFSGLYGHWYPHGRTADRFARALVNQCHGIQQAMRTIRQVIPDARLVQTEDLGRTTSTVPLAYQAAFDNERRWLSLDLLDGRVDDRHALWHYLLESGLGGAELENFLQAPCPPDFIGINHYLTSERFLDHDLNGYPPHTHGGNGRDHYADVEAVRVCAEGLAGPRRLLREAWQRYQRPLAVTEVHLGARREDQLRWLMEVWNSAATLRAEGVPIRAVTVWALLGAFNWNSLVTRDDGYYEPGVFDVRGPQPRPTLLAQAVRALATTGHFAHPVLDQPGWWRRPERLIFPPRRSEHHIPAAGAEARLVRPTPLPLLIMGAASPLGRSFVRVCEARGLACQAISATDMEVADRASVTHALAEVQPWAVIHTAGYIHVDEAEQHPERCHHFNVLGARMLAEACAQAAVPLLTFSSDQVFDGGQTNPYVESSPTAPLNVFGASQAEAETLVMRCWPQALVIRASSLFDPRDVTSFFARALRRLAAGLPVYAATNQVVSPTYVPDLVETSLDLLLDGTTGVWHLANPGAVSWADFVRLGAQAAHLPAANMVLSQPMESQVMAPRPAYSVLGSERGALMPPLEDAVARFCGEAAWRSG